MAPLYWFIVNPKSGSSVKTAAIRTLCERLRQRGSSIRIDFTQSLPHAGEIAAQARSQDVAALLVCGGDGTVRAVAQGAAGGETPIMVIPTGTENLLAGELGLDGTVDVALRTLDYGSVRNLDLGVANGRHFMAVLGVGFDAEVIRRINCFRQGHITHMDYLWPITRTYFEYRFPHLRAVADGRVICDEPGLLFVSNISRYAVGLRVAPQADFSNGMLDVTVYKCRKRHRRRQETDNNAARVSFWFCFFRVFNGG